MVKALCLVSSNRLRLWIANPWLPAMEERMRGNIALPRPAFLPAVPDWPPGKSLRILLVSTPRSGNNWLRRLLAQLYAIPSLAIHNPSDLDWANLEPSCVLGIHWHPVPAFVSLLQRHGFRPLVLARHPLDVLISILQFAPHSSTARWLEGEGGDERSIHEAVPGSAAFLEYATGSRASALLSVSREWWTIPGCLRVRYEDLVAQPYQALTRLVQGLGTATRLSYDAAVEETTIPKLRALTGCPHHFWQGKPGLWKRLLPAVVARLIADTHANYFSALQYACDADPALRSSEADTNWRKLVGAPQVTTGMPFG